MLISWHGGCLLNLQSANIGTFSGQPCAVCMYVLYCVCTLYEITQPNILGDYKYVLHIHYNNCFDPSVCILLKYD